MELSKGSLFTAQWYLCVCTCTCDVYVDRPDFNIGLVFGSPYVPLGRRLDVCSEDVVGCRERQTEWERWLVW